MRRSRIAVLAGLLSLSMLAAAPQVQADSEPDCRFWYNDFGPRPAATSPGGKPPKISFTPPPTMMLGRDYLFQFSTTPTDADGHLKVFFWGTNGVDKQGQIAYAAHARVVDGKVVDANGRRVDAPSLRVHPNLVSRDYQYPLYLVASFRDLATGKYVCQKTRVNITF